MSPFILFYPFLLLATGVPLERLTRVDVSDPLDDANFLYRQNHHPTTASIRVGFEHELNNFRFFAPSRQMGKLAAGPELGATGYVKISLPSPRRGWCLDLDLKPDGSIQHYDNFDAWKLEAVKCPKPTPIPSRFQWLPFEAGKCVIQRLTHTIPIWVTYEMSGCANYFAESAVPGNDPYIMHCNGNDAAELGRKKIAGKCFNNNVVTNLGYTNCLAAGPGYTWEEYCFRMNKGVHVYDTMVTAWGCEQKGGTWHGWTNSVLPQYKDAGLLASDVAKAERANAAVAEINTLHPGANYRITQEAKRSLYSGYESRAFGWGHWNGVSWDNYVHVWNLDPATRPHNLPFTPV